MQTPKRRQQPERGHARRELGHRQRWFSVFAHRSAQAVGTPSAFLVAVIVLVLWGVSGPIFHFSDTWQLVVNTGTTIVTFLIVFLIQNTQNRDAEALHLKIDELVRATSGAKNSMIDLEDLETDELHRIHKEYCELAENARHEMARRNSHS